MIAKFQIFHALSAIPGYAASVGVVADAWHPCFSGMAVLTASQLQTRGSLLARGLGGILVLFLGYRLVQHLKVRGAECPLLAAPPHAAVTYDANNLQDGPGPASQGDEGTLQCEGGFVIDGFQPLHTAAMVCGDSGQWECSDPDADPAEDSTTWGCDTRQCVLVAHCNPLPESVDTGYGLMVMEVSACAAVELGKDCTVGCGEGFSGASSFTCQIDGTWRGTPPSCKFVDPARARLYDKPDPDAPTPPPVTP